MKQKIISVLTFLLVVVFLASCDNVAPPSDTTTVSAEPTDGNTDTSNIGQSTDTDDVDAASGLLVSDASGWYYKMIRADKAAEKVKTAFSSLRQSIISATGATPKLDIDWVKGIADGALVENDEKELLVGLTNRRESHSVYNSLNENEFAVKCIGNKIVIVGKDDTLTVKAVAYFTETYLSGNISSLCLPEDLNTVVYSEPEYIFSPEADAELNGLSLKECKQTELAEGIIYYENLYSDDGGAPVRAYILTVSPGCGVFYTGTPDDGILLENKSSTVGNEINAAVANGKQVIAGINADFFDMGGTCLPRGLCFKEGKALSSSGTRPFFAVLSDGTPVICKSTDLQKYAKKINTAVGGSHILLDGGQAADLGLGTEFGYTRHPRTGVGIRADGTVVLCVVDGRQTAVSNGASLADLAWIFRELGCTDALNLDGGGSSTFILRDVNTDKSTLKNSPSDGSQRKIQDSLLVLIPEKIINEVK